MTVLDMRESLARIFEMKNFYNILFRNVYN